MRLCDATIAHSVRYVNVCVRFIDACSTAAPSPGHDGRHSPRLAYHASPASRCEPYP